MSTTFLCGPCLEGGRKNSPKNWCANCQELLCEGCVEHHKTLKLTRNHQLSDLNTPSAPVQGQGCSTCMYHPLQEIHLYCRSHDSVCCRECIKAYHQPCERNVVPVDTVANGALNSSPFVGCNEDLKILIGSFADLVQNKEKIQTDFLKDVSMARDKIHEIKSSFCKYLDEMEARALGDLNKAEHDIVGRISIEKSLAMQSLRQAEVLKNEVTTASSDKEAFIVSQKVKSFKIGNEQKIKDLSINLQAYSLQPNYLDPVVIPDTFNISFGNLGVRSTPFHVVLTQDLKISVSCFEKGQAVNHEKFVPCMAINDQGFLVLAELNITSSSKVYLFSPAGQQVNCVKIDGVPDDIATIPGGDRIVVLVNEDTLHYMNMNTTLPGAFEEKTVKQSKGCKCVAASFNYIFSGYKHEIIVFDREGNFVQKWQLPSGSLKCMHAENNGDLYYAVGDTVYCRKNLGDEVCLYSSKDLHEITGIDLDLDGNVYISGKKSNNIHVLKQSSGLAEVVLKKEDGANKPRGITINKANNTLYILRSETKPIEVFHFK